VRAEAPSGQRFAALVAARGGAVDYVGETDVGGASYAVIDVRVRDNEDAIRLLNDLAEDDARYGVKVRRLAGSLLAYAQRLAVAIDVEDAEAYARTAHRLVRDGIVFVLEKTQTFRSGDVTLALGRGNCVNTARLLAALGQVVGVGARVMAVKDASGAITHAAAQMQHGGRWHWVEATMAAEYDEEPYAAARRLGIIRDDIAF